MDEDFFRKSDMYHDLYYVTKGRERCTPKHSYGPMIREYFLLHIVLDGKGSFHTKNSKYLLEQGQFFMIFPGEQTFYEADEENPWEYIWFGFSGKVAQKILSTIGITPEMPIGSIQSFHESKYVIEEMSSMDPFTVISRLKLQGKLYELFSLLANDDHVRLNEEKPFDKVNKRLVYTENAIKIIREKYSDTDFLIRDISKELSLNESYLASIFKQTTGKTLHEYLMAYRIQKSRDYLETTDSGIAEVAEKVGYKNPLSYTRIFKKTMGMTPKEYKKARKQR